MLSRRVVYEVMCVVSVWCFMCLLGLANWINDDYCSAISEQQQQQTDTEEEERKRHKGQVLLSKSEYTLNKWMGAMQIRLFSIYV